MTQLVISPKNKMLVADSVNDFRTWIKRKRMLDELNKSEDTEFTPAADAPRPRTGALSSSRCQQMIDLLAQEPLSAAEIAKALGMKDQSTSFKILKKYPQHFRVVGEKRIAKHPYVALWGLVKGQT